MELTAVIVGLRALKERCLVVIYSDSKYVVDAVTKNWARSWQKKGWKKADGKMAQNIDLWEELLTLLDGLDYEFRWVKGHDGHEYIERCDTIAQECAEKYR